MAVEQERHPQSVVAVRDRVDLLEHETGGQRADFAAAGGGSHVRAIFDDAPENSLLLMFRHDGDVQGLSLASWLVRRAFVSVWLVGWLEAGDGRMAQR